jgi:hypothetical protein
VICSSFFLVKSVEKNVNEIETGASTKAKRTQHLGEGDVCRNGCTVDEQIQELQEQLLQS